jgi:hypothetical protein
MFVTKGHQLVLKSSIGISKISFMLKVRFRLSSGVRLAREDVDGEEVMNIYFLNNFEFVWNKK